MNMQRKNTHIHFLTLLLCLASSFFAANSHAQEDYPVAMTEATSVATSVATLSCEVATMQETQLDPLQSMLVQVGLYLNNEEYQNSKTPISKDKAQLIDGKADETTKKWLKDFCKTLPEDKRADVLHQLMISSAFVTLASKCAALKDLSTNIDQFRQDLTLKNSTLKALNSCLTTIQSPSSTVEFDNTTVIGDYFRLTEESLQKLAFEKAQDEKEIKAELATLTSQYESILQKTFPTVSLFYSYTNKPIEGQADVTSAQMAMAAKQSFSQFPPPSTEFTADCNCVKQLYFETRNYHIFSANQLQPLPPPEPKQGDEEKPENNININYENISRIAYDGIKINQNNQIIFNGWKNIKNSFIYQAHRHYSEVDLLVDIENWEQSSQDVIEGQIIQIDSLLFSEHTPKIRESLYSNSTRLDGITLTFRNLYPQPSIADPTVKAEQAASSINAYIKAGLLKFKEYDNPPQLNILLDLANCLGDETCAKGYATELYKNLDICPLSHSSPEDIERCYQDDHKPKHTVFFILVTMPADFEQGNQRLETALNSAFKGATRGQIFLKTLPIIQPNLLIKGKDSNPLVDAVYFGKDMFGGNAYWPMPLESEENYKTVNDIIGKTKDPENEPFANLLVGLAQPYVPFNICKFVCTERTLFRTLFVSYFAFLIFLTFAKQESCVLCSIIENYHKTYIAMWLLLIASFIAWLGCDELWKNYQEEALLIALGAILVWQAINSFTSSSKYVP